MGLYDKFEDWVAFENDNGLGTLQRESASKVLKEWASNELNWNEHDAMANTRYILSVADIVKMLSDLKGDPSSYELNDHELVRWVAEYYEFDSGESIDERVLDMAFEKAMNFIEARNGR